MVTTAADPAVKRLEVSAYTVPTDEPESDGTMQWGSTTLVLVQARAGKHVGLGYTYGDQACGSLVASTLAPIVEGQSAMAVTACWDAMTKACRNLGRPGMASMAIAAVDSALWDLKARLLDLPLATLLDAAHAAIPIYGSGGFTSYSDSELTDQLGGWAAQGIPRVKMKVGRDPKRDLERVLVARQAIGNDCELYVDANGAYSRKQALDMAECFAIEGVRWFEEPVSSDDLDGLRLLRDRGPSGMDIAAGEYGYMLGYFERMLASKAVDCLQADATRCEGITGFLRVAALCQARSLELSAHCGPAIHAHPCSAVLPLRHLEYFHDHVRVEQKLFDGTLEPIGGELIPDLSRPGNGLSLKSTDAAKYAI